ncbi:MAG TPA: hypothetical protein VLE23_11590, partial [Geminicoccaceae bacterium]|nr:hypothetical protein [Geminicoccaceae bacterium]
MTARIYLRPLGLLQGDAAVRAVAGGWALPLGNEGAAFTAGEIWLRSGDGLERASLPAGELRPWAERVGGALATALERRLRHLI